MHLNLIITTTATTTTTCSLSYNRPMTSSTECDVVLPLSISSTIFSLRSPSSCLHILPRPPVTSILPSTFPSVMHLRRARCDKCLKLIASNYVGTVMDMYNSDFTVQLNSACERKLNVKAKSVLLRHCECRLLLKYAVNVRQK